MTIRPYPPGPQPLKITSPSAAAWIVVPLGATISIPSCRRVASCSKPRETSPCTGQISIILCRNASLLVIVIGAGLDAEERGEGRRRLEKGLASVIGLTVSVPQGQRLAISRCCVAPGT